MMRSHFPMSIRSYLTVAVLGLGMMVSFSSSYYLMGVLAEPMAKALAVDTGMAFAALSAAFLISALLTPVSGRWTDLRGGREVLMVAAVLFALALGVMSLARDGALMLAGITLLGAGMGIGYYGPANALLVAVYGDAAKRPITAVSLIGAFGGAVGWPLTAWLIEQWGWRGACLFWAFLNVGLCLPLYRLLLPAHQRGLSSGSADGRVKWDKTLIRLAVLFACGWWVATALAAHLPRVLQQLGLTVAEAAVAAGMMAVAAISVRLLVLVLPVMKCPVIAVRVATLSHPAGVLLALSSGKALAVCVSIGQGLGNGLLSVGAGVLPLHIYGRDNYGLRQALMLMPARFAQAAAPMMFAAIMDISAKMALLVTSGLCLVMFAMTLGIGTARSRS